MNVYIHPNCKTEKLERIKNIVSELKGRTIISGDLNAHHPTWSKGKGNNLGKKVNEIFNELNFSNKNDPKDTTHFNAKTKEANSPDTVWINNENTKEMSKTEIGEDLGSDHLPLINKIKNIKPEVIKNRNKHWIYKKM